MLILNKNIMLFIYNKMVKTRQYRKSKKSRKQTRKVRKQKLWKMKGCARSKSFFCGKKSQRGGGCGCGALPLGGGSVQRGGGCGCGMPSLSGGSHLGAPMMGGMKMGGSDPALVGPPWTGAVSSWPGVAGVDGQTNNFALNSYPAPVDVQTQSISERDGSIFPLDNVKYLKGGRKSIKKGGGFLPQDLVNMGRSVAYGFGSAYNALNGYPAPVDPLPFKDQFARV
jgi:hypothetical protein